MKPLFLFALTVAVSGPVKADVAVSSSGMTPPWSAARLAEKSVPSTYPKEWRKSGNRDHCALLALSDAEKEPRIKPRRANFIGGWAIVYDTPTVRGAFGIAGTGLDLKKPEEVLRFPNIIKWSDGSIASYGLEGGYGPDYVAYLSVAVQTCMYNIWSSRGKEHIEHLISSLRLVDTTKKPGS